YYRLRRPQQDCGPMAHGLSNHVQTPMHAVDEIDVCVPRRLKHGSIPRRLTPRRMGSSILLADISLGLDDTANPIRLAGAAHDEVTAEQIARYHSRRPLVESRRQRPQLCRPVVS